MATQEAQGTSLGIWGNLLRKLLRLPSCSVMKSRAHRSPHIEMYTKATDEVGTY